MGSEPESYDSSYYLDSRYADRGVFSQYFWARRFYAGLIRRAHQGGRLLEVGCGLGEVLRRLQDSFEAYGLDVSEFAVAAASKRAPRASVTRGGVEGIYAFGPGFFDAVVGIHVIEHLERPEEFFKAAYAALKPGGMLFIATPNLSSPSRRIRGSKWYGYSDPTHISMKTAKEWISITRQNGFRIRKAFGDGLWDTGYVPWLPARMQLGIVGLPSIVQTLTCGTFLPAALSESLLLLAERPTSPEMVSG